MKAIAITNMTATTKRSEMVRIKPNPSARPVGMQGERWSGGATWDGCPLAISKSLVSSLNLNYGGLIHLIMAWWVVFSRDTGMQETRWGPHSVNISNQDTYSYITVH